MRRSNSTSRGGRPSCSHIKQHCTFIMHHFSGVLGVPSPPPPPKNLRRSDCFSSKP